MTNWLYGALALLSGSALAIQVGVNNGLRERIGQPIPAAIASFATGTLALILYGLAARPPLPTASALAGGPWWIWLGGTVGACYLVATVTFSPRLGAAGWLAAVVTGQILTSVVLDHFGLIGFAVHPAGARRLVGVALLLAGAAVVLKS